MYIFRYDWSFKTEISTQNLTFRNKKWNTALELTIEIVSDVLNLCRRISHA